MIKEDYKFEARNSKFETISNDPIPKVKTKKFRKFEFLEFGFVSDFDIRILFTLDMRFWERR